MNFTEAVKSVFSQYASFSGRARRSEFWWFALFSFLVGIVAGILDAAIFNAGSNGGPIRILADLALLLPSLAVAARRLHDTGRSGWWLLLIFAVIIGWIVLLVWYVQDSQGDNQYGPSPKGGGAMPSPYMPPPAPPVA